jgi:hypothetical protein
MSLAPDEKITYKEGGPAAVANFEAGVEGFTTRAFRGCGVVTSEPFEVSDGASSTTQRASPSFAKARPARPPDFPSPLSLRRNGGGPDAAAFHAGRRVLHHVGRAGARCGCGWQLRARCRRPPDLRRGVGPPRQDYLQGGAHRDRSRLSRRRRRSFCAS